MKSTNSYLSFQHSFLPRRLNFVRLLIIIIIIIIINDLETVKCVETYRAALSLYTSSNSTLGSQNGYHTYLVFPQNTLHWLITAYEIRISWNIGKRNNIPTSSYGLRRYLSCWFAITHYNTRGGTRHHNCRVSNVRQQRSSLQRRLLVLH